MFQFFTAPTQDAGGLDAVTLTHAGFYAVMTLIAVLVVTALALVRRKDRHYNSGCLWAFAVYFAASFLYAAAGHCRLSAGIWRTWHLRLFPRQEKRAGAWICRGGAWTIFFCIFIRYDLLWCIRGGLQYEHPCVFAFV